ncbi:DUF2283 domain-containing protein [Thiocystis violacea]|uniref:DUF2283 domain-containing protein n=1 Tax=Thiocystis violacea TaxID=13725 RepID=UPI001909025D|nr:DUF2283 domain-containing protein [Thiocystis violacea]
MRGSLTVGNHCQVTQVFPFALDAVVAATKEIEPGIIADDGADDRLIGIEVLSVSKHEDSGDRLLDSRNPSSIR